MPSHEVFGKRHDNVIRDIETLDCSTSFRALNFEETRIEIQAGPVKRMSKVYLMTRDGFTKIKEDAVLSQDVTEMVTPSATMVEITTVARDGKSRTMSMLPIEFLSGWLP